MTSFLTDDSGGSRKPSGTGHTFDAEIELAELDDRGRMAQTWTARARTISKSGLVFVSRRMCYPGRQVMVAVHLADDAPVPLFGVVGECDYEADGLYRCTLTLQEIPRTEAASSWMKSRARR